LRMVFLERVSQGRNSFLGIYLLFAILSMGQSSSSCVRPAPLPWGLACSFALMGFFFPHRYPAFPWGIFKRLSFDRESSSKLFNAVMECQPVGCSVIAESASGVPILSRALAAFSCTLWFECFKAFAKDADARVSPISPSASAATS
jgi:hypothetical protein